MIIKKGDNRLFVIKKNGQHEPFSFRKIIVSAKHAGAKHKEALQVAQAVQAKFKNGMRTEEIFSLVKEALSKESLKTAIRFSLKEAMRRLGPTGFNFEKYIADVLERHGFQVILNQRIAGKCIPDYEIDFVAKRGDIIYLGECKYHWTGNEKIDLKVALYNHARYLDIMQGNVFKDPKYKGLRILPMVVTNSSFTSLVIKYAQCYDLELIGWGYPKGLSLEHMIEEYGLYPVTILPSYEKQYDEIFAAKGITLAKEIYEADPNKLAQKLKIRPEVIVRLKQEAEALFN